MDVQADLVEINVEIRIEKFFFEPIYEAKFRSFDFYGQETSGRNLLLHWFVVPAHIFRIFSIILYEDRSTKNFEWHFNSVCSNMIAQNFSLLLFSRKGSFLTPVAGKNVSWFSIWGKHFFYVEQFCTLIQNSHHNAVKKDDRPYELH